MALNLGQVPFKLTAEDTGIYPHVPDYIGSLMKGVQAHYQPKMAQADIFSKEIGPLAGLASSPNFTGFNPEIQKMIANKIGSYLGNGNGGQGGSSETTPGYASGSDIYSRLSKAATARYGHGGTLNTAKSRLAGEANQWGLPSWVTNKLGGTKLADTGADYQVALDEGIKQLVNKGYPEAQARRLLEYQMGESEEHYNQRIKPLFISKNTEGHDTGDMQNPDGSAKKEKAPNINLAEHVGKDHVRIYVNGEGYTIPRNIFAEVMKKPGASLVPGQ